jgi:hypothetical protein
VEKIESDAFERAKRDGFSTGNAIAFGINPHWDQYVKYEHV